MRWRLLAALLLLPLSPPTAAPQASPLFELVDPPDDVVWIDEEGPSVPFPPLTAGVDVRYLRVSEDASDRLVFTVGFEKMGYDDEPEDLRHDYRVLYLDFSIEELRYRVDVSLSPPFTGSQGGDRGMGIRDDEGRGGRQPAAFHTTFELNELHIVVPKLGLLNALPQIDFGVSVEPPAVPEIGIGTILRDWELQVAGQFRGYGGFVTDYLSSSERTYELATGIANREVKLAFGRPSSYLEALVPVTPGNESLIPVVASNTMPTKRILGLRADTGPQAPGTWNVTAPSSLTIPGSSDRQFYIRVKTSDAIQHGDRLDVLIHGDSFGHPGEEAAVRLRLIAAVLPGDSRGHLFLHAIRVTDGICGYSALPCTMPRHWMNTLERDDRADEDDGYPIAPPAAATPAASQSVWTGYFPLDTPLAHDLVFSPGGIVWANLSFRTSVAFDAEVVAELRTEGTTVGTGSLAQRLEPSSGLVSVPVRVPPATRRVPVNHTGFELVVELRTADPAATLPQGGLAFIPRESSLFLPLVSPPMPPISSSGRLSLARPGEALDYVNPGAEKRIRLVLLNQGDAQETLQLKAASNRPDWALEFLPGSRYRLDPGDSVGFALSVLAPATEPEGAQATITIEATSEGSAQETVRMQLSLVVITSVEVPAERAEGLEDSDAGEKLAPSPGSGDTPSPGAIVGILALLGHAFVRSRTRRRA